MNLGRLVLNTGAAALLVGLVLLAQRDPMLGAPAIAAGVGLLAVVGLGVERAGTAAVLLGLLLAPMDALRPGAGAFVTFSDGLVGLGFLLLVPTMIHRHARLPTMYAGGALIVLTASMLASLLGPAPLPSLIIMLRIVVAAIILPTAMAWWRPRLQVLDLLAAAYVGGQIVSLGYALVSGPEVNNRYDGLSTHVNYFGQSGALAFALCLHLFHRTTGVLRFAVLGAAALCGWSVALSGSRAATIVVAMLIVIYPLVERNTLTGGAVVLFGALAVPLASWALGSVGESSPLSRLLGDSTTSYSDNTRQQKLTESLDRWLASPVLGDGFSNAPLEAHNIYLQVAVVSGAIGLVGFLMILWSVTRPLFNLGNPAHRLCYPALGYAALGMLTNSLWDRFTWTVLMLGFLANFAYTRDGEPTDLAVDEPAEAVR